MDEKKNPVEGQENGTENQNQVKEPEGTQVEQTIFGKIDKRFLHGVRRGLTRKQRRSR